MWHALWYFPYIRAIIAPTYPGPVVALTRSSLLVSPMQFWHQAAGLEATALSF